MRRSPGLIFLRFAEYVQSVRLPYRHAYCDFMRSRRRGPVMHSLVFYVLVHVRLRKWFVSRKRQADMPRTQFAQASFEPYLALEVIGAFAVFMSATRSWGVLYVSSLISRLDREEKVVSLGIRVHMPRLSCCRYNEDALIICRNNPNSTFVRRSCDPRGV